MAHWNQKVTNATSVVVVVCTNTFKVFWNFIFFVFVGFQENRKLLRQRQGILLPDCISCSNWSCWFVLIMIIIITIMMINLYNLWDLKIQKRWWQYGWTKQNWTGTSFKYRLNVGTLWHVWMLAGTVAWESCNMQGTPSQFVMAAQYGRPLYFATVVSSSFFFLSFFHRPFSVVAELDVCHTSTHDVP